MSGAESGHAIIDRLAQRGLHAGGRVVGGHGAPVVERATDEDGGSGDGHEGEQRAERLARDDTAEEPAEESEARDARGHGEEPDDHGAHDAQPHAAGERPESPVEVHGQAQLYRLRGLVCC